VCLVRTSSPYGGLRSFHQKSTCLHRNFRVLRGANLVTSPPPNPGESKPAWSTVWPAVTCSARNASRARWAGSTGPVYLVHPARNLQGGLRSFHQKSNCLRKIHFRVLRGAKLVTLPPKCVAGSDLLGPQRLAGELRRVRGAGVLGAYVQRLAERVPDLKKALILAVEVLGSNPTPKVRP
jgi:hypothetical protein